MEAAEEEVEVEVVEAAGAAPLLQEDPMEDLPLLLPQEYKRFHQTLFAH